MIVLDENVHQQSIMEAVAAWWYGRVADSSTITTEVPPVSHTSERGQSKGGRYVIFFP